MRSLRLTPEVILRAYSVGIFPMAHSRHDPAVEWVAPARRGIVPLDRFRASRRLWRTERNAGFEVVCDRAFDRVVDCCGAPRPGHPETWINPAIAAVFRDLHRLGHAHSVEAWRDGALAGGLYGLALGGAFFGESMFSHQRDASKVALLHLVARLRIGGFRVLDVQFLTAHLAQFGAIEVSAAEFLVLLRRAIVVPAVFYSELPPPVVAAELVAMATQSTTQTS